MSETAQTQTEALRGLTSAEVAQRVEEGRTNANTDVKTKTIPQILREHTFTLFNLVNLVLALLVLSTGQLRNMTFMLVVLINLFVGVWQEIRAKRMVDSLSILTANKVRVIRDGKESEVGVDELVLDDLFMLSHGDQVPADAVVVRGGPLMDESLLTGESNNIEKHVGDELYSGSFVVAGAVTARVCRVGLDGFAAKINAEARYVKPVSSEILSTLKGIIKYATICLVPLGVGLFLRTVSMGDTTFDDAILSTVAAVVGMIPQGLVLLTSSVLAIATTRLGAKRVLVQQSYCVETLARVDTLCLDKTGTITSGRMEVTAMRAAGAVPYDDRLCKDMLLCATTVMSANGADANETAKAILRFSEEVGFEPAAAAGQVTELLPFADGSVLLCFSFKKVRQKLKVRARCKHHYALYHFGSRADLSAFLGAARRWAQLPDAVYESEGAYRVLYRNPARQTENLLKEYAQRLSLPFALQRTAEYWHALEYGECR